MNETRASEGQSPPCAIDISHLRDEQRRLLVAVLRAGDIPFDINRNQLAAAGAYESDLRDAIAWVTAPEQVDSDFNDPEYRSDLPPLVKPSRSPLPDGRWPATRWRRVAGGVIDQVLAGVPTGLAAKAHAATWMVIGVHMFYFVVSTAMFSWTIGKLIVRTRVVDRSNHRPPNWWRAIVRWAVPYSPVIVGLTVGLPGDVMGILIAFVYLPVMIDLRGWHDRAARTLVVEVSPAISPRPDQPRTRASRRL